MRIIKEFSSKPFKYGLFIGIGIWLIGLIGLQLCISSEYTVARYDSFLLFYPPIRTVGFLLIFFFVVYMIYPLLEEYIFRFWAQKKNYLAILSYSLICIIIFIFLRNWIITIAFIVLFAIVHFILKNDIRKVGIFLLSSTAFAAIHTTTWPAFSIGWIFCFCIFFGMGLILSFTIINYDFGTTIIVRIVFNVLLFANLFISPSYETENYNFYISPIEEKSWTNVEVNNDTVICVGSISQISKTLINNPNLSYEEEMYQRTFAFTENAKHNNLFVVDDLFYRITIIPKNNNSQKNYGEIVKVFEKSKIIKLDTTYAPYWVVSMNDSITPTFNSSDSSLTIGDIARILRFRFNKPVIVDKSVTYKYSVLLTNCQKFIDSNNFDECIEILSASGIKLYRTPYNRAEIITINPTQ